MKKSLSFFLFIVFVSCDAIFLEDITSLTVTPQAPLNNSEVDSGSVTFSWRLTDQAELYKIQIAEPDFQNASQILLDTTLSSNTIQKSLDVGDYQWRIKAMNSDYETAYQTINFSVN